MILALGNMLGRAGRGGSYGVARNIAFTGDSITRQNSTVVTQLDAIGYAAWARAFGGSVWDFEPNGSSDLLFATNGYTCFQVGSVHIPQVLASNADTCFVHAGTNDSANTSANVANELLRIWLELRDGGITPIASTILPVTGPALKSAWIVATNELIRAAARSNNIPLCDWTNVIDLGTNTGVTNTTFCPDGLHPGQTGAAALGRFLSEFLATNFTLNFDPWSAPGTLKTRNPQFAGTTGSPPTSWRAPTVPSGGTLNSQSLVADSETGGNWWTLDVTQGAATGFFTLTLDFVGQPSILNLSCYAIMDVEVVSGTFATVGLQGPSFATAVWDIQAGSSTNGAGLTSSDGVVTLRTPTVVVNSSGYYTPGVNFKGTGVIRVRRSSFYSVP